MSKVEAYLGKPIMRLNDERGFDHWLEVYGHYLPSPQMRWCTRQLDFLLSEVRDAAAATRLFRTALTDPSAPPSGHHHAGRGGHPSTDRNPPTRYEEHETPQKRPKKRTTGTQAWDRTWDRSTTATATNRNQP